MCPRPPDLASAPSRQDAAIKALARQWREVPMREWPREIFEQLGLRNPYELGNLTLPREALAATRHLQGAVVECGTYRGQGLATLSWLMREEGDTRSIFGCDSFQGFPRAATQDLVDGRLPRQSLPAYYAKTSEQEVRAFFDALGLGDRITLLAGFFSETLPSAPIESIAVLLLDCDLYASYRVSLQCLYPKVQAGGWIIFDEYFSPKYPGARVAVDEFFATRPEQPTPATHLLAEHPYERWYVVKA